jgi:hypothetical protein
MLLSGMQISPIDPAKPPFSTMMSPSVFLLFVAKTAGTSAVISRGFAVFSFSEPSAAQDFRGN